jgi:hypothetical protein
MTKNGEYEGEGRAKGEPEGGGSAQFDSRGYWLGGAQRDASERRGRGGGDQAHSKSSKQNGERKARFEQGEMLTDALMRAGAEWEITFAEARRNAGGGKACRVKCNWRGPKSFETLGDVGRHDHR